jgi:hypothetical protein
LLVKAVCQRTLERARLAILTRRGVVVGAGRRRGCAVVVSVGDDGVLSTDFGIVIERP